MAQGYMPRVPVDLNGSDFGPTENDMEEYLSVPMDVSQQVRQSATSRKLTIWLYFRLF